MTKKSFLMTLGVGLLVVSMGLTSCTKKPKPATSSSSAPTSEVSDNSSSQADVSTSSLDKGVSSNSSVDVSSENPSSVTSENSSSTLENSSSTLENSSSTLENSSSSTSENSSSSSTDDPITTGVTIKIGTADPVAMEDVSDNKGATDTWDKQYKITTSVKAGDKLEFAIDGTVVTKIGPDAGENNLSKEMTVINDAEGNIYFKVYPDGGHSVWVEGLDDQGGTDDPITTGVTIKIGAADPVAMEDVSDNKGATDTWDKQYKITTSVKAGDKLEFAIDGTVVTKIGPDAGENNLSKEMAVINDAEGNIYFKVYPDGGHSVWVEGLDDQGGTDDPITTGYELNVNGTKATVGNLDKGPTDAYACTVDLKKDDVLKVTNNGTELVFGATGDKEFKCAVEGTHKVYINGEGKVYLIEPLAPVGTKYTVTVNGTEKAITLIPDSENHAQFKLTLTKGDKVVVLGDGKALTGGAYEGTEYTVKATGEHTFYVNAEDKVYLTAPTPSDVTTITLSVNFKAITQGNERYAAYLFGGKDNEWVDLTIDSNKKATITLTEEQAAKYTGIIFCRMNGSTTANNWNNKWDQTADLVIDGNEEKTFTVTGCSNGKISGSWN